MCQVCKGKGWVREIISVNGRSYPVFYRCACEAGQKYSGFPEFKGEHAPEPGPNPGGKVVKFPGPNITS